MWATEGLLRPGGAAEEERKDGEERKERCKKFVVNDKIAYFCNT